MDWWNLEAITAKYVASQRRRAWGKNSSEFKDDETFLEEAREHINQLSNTELIDLIGDVIGHHTDGQ